MALEALNHPTDAKIRMKKRDTLPEEDCHPFEYPQKIEEGYKHWKPLNVDFHKISRHVRPAGWMEVAKTDGIESG